MTLQLIWTYESCRTFIIIQLKEKVALPSLIFPCTFARPDWTSYWNALVHGRKRWMFLTHEDSDLVCSLMSLMSLSDCLLTHLDDSWRLTQGFMMVYEELTSLADLVISKGLTQDWDVPSFTGLLSNFAWISQKTCQLSACFDVI